MINNAPKKFINNKLYSGDRFYPPAEHVLVEDLAIVSPLPNEGMSIKFVIDDLLYQPLNSLEMTLTLLFHPDILLLPLDLPASS